MTNWQTKTIGELVDYEQPSKYLVKDTNYIEDGIPVLTANKAFILGYTHETEGIYVASKDNPVIIFDDFTTDNKFVDFDFKVKSSAIKILTAKPSKVLPRFVHGAMRLIKTGITEHKRRFISEYQFHPIDMPELAEQERIVGVLEVWDEYIEKLEQKIALKEQLKKGLMQQLLTGKRRLPEFNARWESLKFADVAIVERGKMLTAANLTQGKYPVIAGGKTSPYSHGNYTHEDVVTISGSGASAGYVAYHDYKIWASDCSVIEGKKGVSITKYLSLFLKYNQKRLYALQSGGAQPHVYPSDIKALNIEVPEVLEQEAIVKVLHVLEEDIGKLLEKSNSIVMQKKYLLINLITGTIRTPEDLKPLDASRLERSAL